MKQKSDVVKEVRQLTFIRLIIEANRKPHSIPWSENTMGLRLNYQTSISKSTRKMQFLSFFWCTNFSSVPVVYHRLGAERNFFSACNLGVF